MKTTTMKIIKKLQKDYIWSFTTYFTEGFPFVLIRTVSSVFFRDMKVSLEAIGLTSLYGLPWIIKFLWSPQVDEYGTKRKWLIFTQFTLLLSMILAAAFIPFSMSVQAVATIFFIASFFAATHDVAIDGYYMEALDDAGQARFVGFRVMAYRIAMMTGTGGIVSIGTIYSWSLAFWAAAIIFALFFLFHFFFLKEVQEEGKPLVSLTKFFYKKKNLLGALFASFIVLGIRSVYKSQYYAELKNTIPILKKVYFSHWIGIFLLIGLVLILLFRNKIRDYLLKDPDSFYSKAFVSFVDREKIGIILSFLLLLRTGEYMLTTMVAPFIVDLGIKVHYGWLSAGVGLPAGIIGAVVGGWAISKYSLRKVIWPFILAQNLTNVVYMILAFYLKPYILMNTGATDPASIGAFNLGLVAFVQFFDQFAGGLGTAVLMTYLMRLCIKEYKAAHYAIGASLWSVGGMFSGVLSGFIAGSYGYGWNFCISFIVSIPAMILIPMLPKLKETS
jgi:PAT family beta-lactamase induction signal transducer AmpG